MAIRSHYVHYHSQLRPAAKISWWWGKEQLGVGKTGQGGEEWQSFCSGRGQVGGGLGGGRGRSCWNQRVLDPKPVLSLFLVLLGLVPAKDLVQIQGDPLGQQRLALKGTSTTTFPHCTPHIPLAGKD